MKPVYGLVGDGRLARHLDHYFTSLRIPLLRWSRGSKRGPGTGIESLSPCAVLLLAVSDRAIEPVAREARACPSLRDKTRVHFSGALSSSLAFGFHPLASFGDELDPPDSYRDIAFIGERGGPAFHSLFPELPNPSYTIDPSKKALYHALCAMSGNFSALLWTRLFEGLERDFGIPPEAALPYLRRVSASLASHPRNPRATWTGPLVRGDHETVGRHLAALTGDPYEGVYRAFTQAFEHEEKHK